MIFVTGDTHGLHDFAKLLRFAEEHPGLTKEDHMIIAGDFGGIWDENSPQTELPKYEALPFTTLFVDGNHENFDLLEAYPVEVWKGGKVHVIRPGILHLMRGQVFEIDGNTVFTFGGATSIDRIYRTEGKGWWRREVPTYEELDEGIANLRRYGNRVDYIITHSCDEKALWYPPLRGRGSMIETFQENRMLSCFESDVTYKHWYFGHYHMDADLTEDKTVLYQAVVPLGKGVQA